jgi:hypothetical protein
VSHGTLTLNADGSFTYTPAAGYSGSDSFTYVANDGTVDSSIATVNLTINAGATILSFTPSDDAMVSSKSPVENFGSLATLELRQQSNEIIHSYLKFTVTGVSGTIVSAKVRLYVDKDSSDGGSIYSVSNDYLNTAEPWLEDGLLWDNAPGFQSAPLSSVPGATSGTWVEFDVAAVVTADGTYSFGLDTDSRNRVVYSSSEAVDIGPVLAIEIE